MPLHFKCEHCPCILHQSKSGRQFLTFVVSAGLGWEFLLLSRIDP
jgi:hypothetical protein